MSDQTPAEDPPLWQKLGCFIVIGLTLIGLGTVTDFIATHLRWV